MDPFTSILVDIDASASAHPALERAARIARASGASLTIADVVSMPRVARHALSSELEAQVHSQRREQLARIAREAAAPAAQARLLSGAVQLRWCAKCCAPATISSCARTFATWRCMARKATARSTSSS